ncbi:integrase core domain protein (plasmid) [Escherichia coli B171]|uniref:Transposase n=3 Tax=Escherichia coli TaxID=562 RepID=A0A345DL99_ECOLX|nr:integrase core domain protein [Escherichia coli B171]AXF94863.1 hypothetical protein pHN32wt_00405 [Escherichia coli]AXF94958.1 hypothetical protein pHN32_1_00370 [Escherichia coli]
MLCRDSSMEGQLMNLRHNRQHSNAAMPQCRNAAMPQRKHKGRILVKEDYIAFMPKQNLRTALHNLALAIEYYNENHPHSAFCYLSPREYRHQRVTLT